MRLITFPLTLRMALKFKKITFGSRGLAEIGLTGATGLIGVTGAY